MPVKTKRIHHHAHHDKTGKRRAKHFLKVYAPYIPLLLILASGFLVAFNPSLKPLDSRVLSYAVNVSSDSLLQATNQQRTKRNLNALTTNAQLTRAAQAKAEDMAALDYWSHTTPDGEEPWYFIQKAGYTYSKAAENLAYGFDSSTDTITGWMNSAEHRANLLDSQLRDVGFGIARSPDYQHEGPQTIVVALYGTPAETRAPAASSTVTPPAPTDTLSAPPRPQKISVAQSLSGGLLPWINFAAGVLIGVIIVYLLTKHGRRLHRSLRRGEKFILHHPLLDITLVALLGLAVILTRTTGIIH